MERACRLSAGHRHEAFSVEPCRAGRGDGPQPVAPVLMGEPNRVGRQSLGRGVGCEAAVVVAQQAGGGRDPQRTGLILQQVTHGVALELRRVFAIERDKVNAVEADQAPVRAQPQIAVTRLQNGVDGVLRQPGIGAPSLVAEVLQRPLRLERDGAMRPRQQQCAHTTPSPDCPDHDGYSINPAKFHAGRKKMRPESGRMENWYVIAIPKIDPPATQVLDPGEGFWLDLSVDTRP